MEKRNFYKCPCCLATTAISARVTRPVCGICESGLEYMGQVVEEHKWIRREEKCKCDSRCVNASGPSCDCQCGGENHGAGRDGYYTVDADTGETKITPAKDVEKHKAIADEYLAAYNGAVDRIEKKHGKENLERYSKRVWLAETLWRAIRNDLWVLEKADVKIHKTRLAKLALVAV